MRWLFVLAHPDDEADVGGTIWRLSVEGDEVAIAILVGNASARRNLSETLDKEMRESMDILGVKKVYHASFPNIKTNIVPQLDIIRFVEECIVDWKAEAIVTHHCSDVNIDHVVTGNATLAACRSYFKNNHLHKLRILLMCETASATEWALNSSQNRFKGNYFVEIGDDGMERKNKAHSVYKGVIRPFPHPQCNEVYYGLAAYRGAQCGCSLAEAYECVFKSELKTK